MPGCRLTIDNNYCDNRLVKTVTKSISLHEDLAEFAVREAEEGCYGNVSAYFAELLRKARQERIDQDLKLLADGVTGSGSEPPDEEIVAHTKSVRRRMRQENWRFTLETFCANSTVS